MSLRAQLQAPQGNTRPIIAAQLNTDNLHDASRVNVLLWVPRSNGAQFLAGHASGNIIVYKKVRVCVEGEGGGSVLVHMCLGGGGWESTRAAASCCHTSSLHPPLSVLRCLSLTLLSAVPSHSFNKLPLSLSSRSHSLLLPPRLPQ